MTIFENIEKKMPNLIESKGDKIALEARNHLSKLVNLKTINFKKLKEELSQIKDSKVLNYVLKGLAIGTSAFLLNASDGNAQELKYTKNPDGTVNIFKENVTQKVKKHGKETITITKTSKEDIGTATEEASDTTFTIESNKVIENKNSQIQVEGIKYQKMSQAPDQSLVKPNGDYRKLGSDWYQRVSDNKEVKKDVIKQNLINIDGNKYVSCDFVPTKEMINTGNYRKLGQIWYTKNKL